MTDRVRNLVVGLTAIAGLAAFATLLMLFGYVPDWLEGGYEVRVQLPDAAGLNKGSRVKMSGVDIGRVDGVELLTPASRGVMVVTKIRETVGVPADVRAGVKPTLLGGSPNLEFDIGHLAASAAPAELNRDGSAVIVGQTASLTGEIGQQLKTGINQLGAKFDDAIASPRKDLTRLVDSFEKLSIQWAAVGENVNKLTEQRTPADVDKSSGALKGNLTTVLARADERLAEMQEAIKGLSAWAGDQQLRTDFRDTVANAKVASASLVDTAKEANKLVARAGGSLDKVDAAVDSARANIDQLAKRYIAAADDLSGAVQSMRKTIDEARDGQGTLGKLIKDPSLYNNLNDSVKRLDTALTDMKLLIQKWEKEGIIKF